ncbi:catechol 1,2-dioxygenase [Devosia sp. ZB163]|uniref:VOC family protein n=1 Tax=Devosia sp. ZB163 TaxID=3025938 RepID=UPI00235F07EA|nr:VOC family protein [Devosia sp. ZB163]MDC9823413.1 catechol 1,2-dioxygenase [Devosia sp. ZB163]
MITVESQAAVRSAPVLPLATHLGPVRIGVTNRENALAVWRDVLGLELISEDAEALHLGAGGTELIILELGAKTPFPDRSLGLYHVAVHVPTRKALAEMVVRALMRRVRISPTDHLVSEAIYLSDYDNNGIEITFETPWRGTIGDGEDGYYVKTVDGSPHSGREAIDVDDLLAELDDINAVPAAMPEGTRIGHIHLHVNDLERAMRFYRDGIGFGGLFIMRQFGMGDLGLDYPPHTIAFNIWSGPNAAQASKGSAGLRWFHIVVPDQAALDAVRGRLAAIGAAYTDTNEGLDTRDPADNLVKLVVAR